MAREKLASKIGIYLADGIGIGDKLQFGCLPENFYRNTGEKLVDLNSSFIFDYNPYVERTEFKESESPPSDPTDVIYSMNAWSSWGCKGAVYPAEPESRPSRRVLYGLEPAEKLELFQERLKNMKTVDLWGNKDWPPSVECLSKSERWCKYFDLETCFLRHPRIYIYEDLPTQNDLVTVHTVGKTKGTLTNEVIGQINKNYKGYNIVQVGGKDDKETPFTDKRGLDFFKSAEIIAQSQIFIGPSSSMYHLSRCYSRVRKKVVILDQDDSIDREKLKTFIPYKNGYDDWLDFDTELYNESDYDIGVTRTYKKI